MKELDWKKVAKWFIGFVIAKILMDYTGDGKIDDVYGVIGIPIITLGLIYLVDKKWLIKEEE